MLCLKGLTIYLPIKYKHILSRMCIFFEKFLRKLIIKGHRDVRCPFEALNKLTYSCF